MILAFELTGFTHFMISSLYVCDINLWHSMHFISCGYLLSKNNRISNMPEIAMFQFIPVSDGKTSMVWIDVEIVLEMCSHLHTWVFA